MNRYTTNGKNVFYKQKNKETVLYAMLKNNVDAKHYCDLCNNGEQGKACMIYPKSLNK